METLRTEERERLSRDLHDDLGQLLTGFKLEVSQIAKSQQSLLEKLSRLATISDTTIEQVQRISSDLRQEALIELGLPRAIEKQAEDFQARSGIACRVMVDKSFRDLEQNLSTMLLRVLQEALSNVVRHSAASQVEIELKESKDCLRLQITDNGRGVDESVVDDPRSLGIQGMRERAKPFGGKVGIVNVKPSGTAVIVEVSLGKSSEKESL